MNAAVEALARQFSDNVQFPACGVDKTNPNCDAILNTGQKFLAQIDSLLGECAAAAERNKPVVGSFTAILAQSPAARGENRHQ